MSPRESSIVRTILRKANKVPGVRLRKTHGSVFGRRGEPDLYGNVGPLALYLEVKRPGGKSTRLQLLTATAIGMTGARFATVHDWPETLREIEQLQKLGKLRGGTARPSMT